MYTPLQVVAGNDAARVLMRAPNGDALVVAQAFGNGEVVTCAVPWFQVGLLGGSRWACWVVPGGLVGWF